MKYDILNKFKERLHEEYTPNTAKRYYSAVNTLFQGLQFDSLDQITKEDIESRIQNLKTKNEVSAAKNGLKNLSNMDPTLQLPDQDYFQGVSGKKRNIRKNKGEKIHLDTVKRKVNQISNNKLRLAYRLAMVSGARVSELADLEKQNIVFEDGKITVNIIDGKGGKDRIIECLPDPYVYKHLQEYLNDYTPEDTVFYSESYMREKAWELGLEMHDFRRIFAILEKRRLRKEGLTAYEANRVVMAQLGHDRYETTKRYLFGKKLIVKR